MIPVAELEKIAQARLDDAKALLAAGRFDAATYLCGYAVELALKARICRTLNWSDFPRTPGDFRSYRSFRTHDLQVLLHLSGQEARITRQHFALWYVLVVWTPEQAARGPGREVAAFREGAGPLAEQLTRKSPRSLFHEARRRT